MRSQTESERKDRELRVSEGSGARGARTRKPPRLREFFAALAVGRRMGRSWGPDDQFVIDQHPRGYARLVDEMVRDTVPPGDPRVLLNTEVTRIQYDCAGVVVSTRDGRAYKATEVISTLPLGVLQRRHREIFEPPLPPAQVEVRAKG